MKSKVFLFAITLAVFTTFSVKAQRGQMNQRTDRPFGPNPEMKAYIEQNVVPVMKIQRQELDNKIDAADKVRIEEIRTELKSLRTIMKDKREAFRESDEKPTLEQRKEMREHRSKMHNLMDEVAILSEKYDAAISTALDEINKNAETWKQEMRDQCPNRNRGMRAGNNNGPKDRGNKPKFNNGNERGEMPLQRFLSPEGFLLWNPEEPLPMFDENEAPENSLNVNLFPNPAAKTVQISITLDNDETIAIEFMDQDGNVVQKAKETAASKGIFTESFNLNKLDNGIYFVKIRVGAETTVERLIIQK